MWNSCKGSLMRKYYLNIPLLCSTPSDLDERILKQQQEDEERKRQRKEKKKEKKVIATMHADG